MEFKPMLTPKEMLHKGIFGGTYFAELVDYKEFPEDWLDPDNNAIESIEVFTGATAVVNGQSKYKRCCSELSFKGSVFSTFPI